jgi:hypothetical protein
MDSSGDLPRLRHCGVLDRLSRYANGNVSILSSHYVYGVP